MIKEKVIYKILSLNLFVAILFIILGASYSLLGKVQITKTIIDIGILLIICSPLFRVILELIFFIKEKNYIFVSICLILFAIITISIFC
ncbi:MAG: hypothetical protein Kow0076_5400 [Francisella sp.]